MSVVTEEALTIAAAMVAEEATRCPWESISEQGQAQWLSRMRAALAAVAPIIAAAERERCARVVENKNPWRGARGEPYHRMAAAIRALDAPAFVVATVEPDGSIKMRHEGDV